MTLRSMKNCILRIVELGKIRTRQRILVQFCELQAEFLCFNCGFGDCFCIVMMSRPLDPAPVIPPY